MEQLVEGLIAVTPVEKKAIRFFAPSPLLQQRAANMISKEPDMIRWINGLSNDAVFWDIGANVGVFSLYAATQQSCKVLAFEPAAANFYALTRNISLNGLGNDVHAYCVALAGATELGSLKFCVVCNGGGTECVREAW